MPINGLMTITQIEEHGTYGALPVGACWRIHGWRLEVLVAALLVFQHLVLLQARHDTGLRYTSGNLTWLLKMGHL